MERNPRKITAREVLLYVWIAAFAYDEFGEFRDAGLLFYQTDFWSLWDVGIILTGAAFLVARVVGLVKDSDKAIDISFDVLSLEALFLVPRICSVMSLNPYFGSLIPVLKEMVSSPCTDHAPSEVWLTRVQTKAFCKFLPVIVVLYLGNVNAPPKRSMQMRANGLVLAGFLTTFTMLARDRLSLNEMSWILIKVFFGSSYLGFDVAVTVSEVGASLSGLL